MILLLLLQLLAAHEPVVASSLVCLTGNDDIRCSNSIIALLMLDTIDPPYDIVKEEPTPASEEWTVAPWGIANWPLKESDIGKCVAINEGVLECVDPRPIRFKQIIECGKTLCALDGDGEVWIYKENINSVVCVNPDKDCVIHTHEGWIRHSENPTKGR